MAHRTRRALCTTPLIPDGHIDPMQAVSMMIMAVSMKAFLAFPERVTRLGQTAGWFVPLGAALLSLLWVWPISEVLSAYPGANLIDISRKLGGKPFGVFMGLMQFALGVALCAPCAHQTAQVLTMAILPRTPLPVLFVLGFAVSLYIASRGTEVLGRLSLIGALMLAGSVGVLLLLSASYWTLNVFRPWLGPGIVPLLKIITVRQAIYDEIFILGIIAPYLRRQDKIKTVAFSGLFASAVILALVIAGAQMALSYPRIVFQTGAFLRLARKVFLGKFVQRLDAPFVSVWVAVSVIRTSLSIYASSLALSSTFGMQTYRAALPISTGIILIGSILIPDLATAVIIDFDIVRPYSVPLLVGWPWLLYGLHRWRTRSKKRGAQN